MPKSGNCYKVAWMLSLVQKPFEMVPVNTLKGEQRLPTFLEKNPLGKIPVLELDNGQCLSESNAILLHLAETSNRQPSLIPSDPYRRGLVYQCYSLNSIPTRRSCHPDERPRYSIDPLPMNGCKNC